MKTITIDEVKKLPPLDSKEIERIKSFVNTNYEDCPKQTLAGFLLLLLSSFSLRFLHKQYC